MTFMALNANVTDLRNSLRTYVGTAALPEISIRPPVGSTDEASFLRLTGWSYALLYESGRVTIPFLLGLPPFADNSRMSPAASRELVRSLRTWSSHNLGLSDHDVSVSREALGWFNAMCGTQSPTEPDDWETCFTALCREVNHIVTHCNRTVDLVVRSAEDGHATVTDLLRRLDRNWPSHEFDKLVGDICIRLGESIDIHKFRSTRLQSWREHLESLPDGENLKNHMIRRIERDVLDYFNNLLPIDGRDVIDELGVQQGPEVGKVLTEARRLLATGIRDREALLQNLRNPVDSD